MMKHRNIEEVKKAFTGFYWEIDADNDHDTVVNELARIMRLHFRTGSLASTPEAVKILRRPPRILVTGPPGSGKTTLSQLVAQRFGLVHVSASELLEKEIAQKTAMGRQVEGPMRRGELVSNDTISELVKQRLNETDCQVNGWTLEGFPRTEAQITMLKGMKQMPSLVVLLETDDDIVYERHEYKKVSPITGEVYSLKDSNLTSKRELLQKLVSRDCDKHNVVKKRLNAWKEFVPKLNELLKEHKVLTLTADKSVSDLLDAISETIESLGKEAF